MPHKLTCTPGQGKESSHEDCECAINNSKPSNNVNGDQQAPTFAAFAGSWQLERVITDHLADQRAMFSGCAEFSLQEDGFLYEERGTLAIPGQPEVAATRRYFWQSVGDDVQVSFEDGREFHRFSLSQTHPVAEHDCPPDFYHVAYDFSLWPCWTALWQVTGPRKNYEIRSQFSRTHLNTGR